MERSKTNRKAVKNPFAKIHKEALKNNGYLSDEERRRMMKEAIDELQQQYGINRSESVR